MIITNSQLRKVINEELQIVLVEQQMELWEQRTTRDLDKLLSEIDLKGTASAAIEKINNFVHTAGVKAWQFMQKGKEAAMKGINFLSRILQRIQSFCAKRPKVCGAAKVFLAVMTMAGVVIVTTGAAQAAPGGIEGMISLDLTPEMLDQVIGAAKVAMRPLELNPGDAGGLSSYGDQISEYVRVLNELRNSQGMKPEALSKMAQKTLSIGLETLQDSHSGNIDAFQELGAAATRAAQSSLNMVLDAAREGSIGLDGPVPGLGPK